MQNVAWLDIIIAGLGSRIATESIRMVDLYSVYHLEFIAQEVILDLRPPDLP